MAGEEFPGVDDKGRHWASPAAFWAEVLAPGPGGAPSPWYREAVAYWDGQAASDDGVLGGFAELTEPDLRDSAAFLDRVVGRRPRSAGRPSVAADCGAGIGRVAKGILLDRFDEVDLIEPSRHLLEEAKRALPGGKAAVWVDAEPGGGAEAEADEPASPAPAGSKRGAEARVAPPPPAKRGTRGAVAAATAAGRAAGRASRFYCCGLEAWSPSAGRYDVVWVQWALLYLTDDDLLGFLARLRLALVPGGLLCAKENVTEKGFVVDWDDLSVTRSNAYYQALFKKAGMRLLASATQKGFPTGLYKIRMWALQFSDGDDE